MVNTPVGVRWPGRPVLTLDRAMRIPLRYIYATCSVMLATINKGPSGPRSGSQTYSPGFSVTVSGDTRTPSVKVSAKMIGRSRTSRPAAKAINTKNFIVVNPVINWFAAMISLPLGSVNVFLMQCMRESTFTRDRGEGGSGPRRHTLAIGHVERVLAPQRGCGRP